MAYEFPARGEIWRVRTEAGEQRLALVLSTNQYNEQASPNVVVLYITEDRLLGRFDIPIEPHESGLERTVYVQCDAIAAVPKRLKVQQAGLQVQKHTMERIENYLQTVLGLPEFKRRTWL